LERFQKAVQSTKSTLVARLDDIVLGKKTIDAGMLEDLEQVLIGGDVGLATTQEVLESVRQAVDRGQANDAAELKSAVKRELMEFLKRTQAAPARQADPPVVLLVV